MLVMNATVPLLEQTAKFPLKFMDGFSDAIYCISMVLQFGQHSTSEVQQGDPLGSLVILTVFDRAAVVQQATV